MRLAVKIAYDGCHFHGFARQPKLRTVEGDILQALRSHHIITDTTTAQFRFASRTDKGVSALGNVIAFNTSLSPNMVIDSLQQDFTDILVVGIAVVDSDFYPRHARNRIYKYYLKKNDAEMTSLLSTLSLFTGYHSFVNFARVETGKNPFRTIDHIIVSKDKGFYVIEFSAQTFLWQQIRRIISAVILVENDKITKEDICTALESSEKLYDFRVADAQPLFLQDVVYDFSFDIDIKKQDLVKRLEKNVVRSL